MPVTPPPPHTHTHTQNNNKQTKQKQQQNNKQMPMAKKERPNHKCWWQTKKGCPNQASKQLKPNERNKTAETTSNTQTVAYLQK